MKKKDDRPVKDRIFRYWVELRDVRDNTVRELPVTFITRIALVSRKKNDPPEAPPELRVRVQDDGRTWEAVDRDDLARQLRGAYPDGTFERTMKCERDLDAEEKHCSAIDDLARIIARATVRKMLADEAKK